MTKRVCWCPCKASLEGMRTDAIWKSKACALRWSREHPGEPLPGRGNAHIIDTRTRSGLQLAYRRTYDVLVDHFISRGEDYPEALARKILSAGMSTRQREQLERRAA